MRTITCGRSRQFQTRVSDEDYAHLMQWLWTYAVSHKGGELIYIRRSIKVAGASVTILMQRVVIERMGLVQPTPRHTVHHIDGDALNNQRENLTWLSPTGQMAENRVRYARAAGQMVWEDIPF
jgi:hypothetical protein